MLKLIYHFSGLAGTTRAILNPILHGLAYTKTLLLLDRFVLHHLKLLDTFALIN